MSLLTTVQAAVTTAFGIVESFTTLCIYAALPQPEYADGAYGYIGTTVIADVPIIFIEINALERIALDLSSATRRVLIDPVDMPGIRPLPAHIFEEPNGAIWRVTAVKAAPGEALWTLNVERYPDTWPQGVPRG